MLLVFSGKVIDNAAVKVPWDVFQLFMYKSFLNRIIDRKLKPRHVFN